MIILFVLLSLSPQNIQKYEKAKIKAIKFVESIKHKINPINLRKNHGMKGKKHFVEYLNFYRALYVAAKTDSERVFYKEKVKEVISPIYKKEYHNLKEASFNEFKEDVISYLGACYILNNIFGFDMHFYKEEIRKVLTKIISKEHLDKRGVDNNMAITFYLRELGFGGGYSYCECYRMPGCVLREQPPLCNINWNNPWHRTKIYDLTHEIFLLTNYGKTKIECATKADINYAKQIIPKLISICMKRKDPDLVAELLICMHYLGLNKNKEYNEAIDYLLNSQNKDGSWGNYEKEREYVKIHRPKYLVEVGQYLHTTQVVMWVLSLIIEEKNENHKITQINKK